MPSEYTGFDKALRQAVTLRFDNGPRVLFQFPPRITNDNRKGEWKETNQYGTEPSVAFAKSGPREITLTWTYIVDGSKDWTTTTISDQVKIVRGYFARVRNPGGADFRNLVVFFKMWKLGGDKEMTFYIRGIDVKHSDTIVSPCQGNPTAAADLAYPLRTDITLDLRLWTRGGPESFQDLQRLIQDEEPKWY